MKNYFLLALVTILGLTSCEKNKTYAYNFIVANYTTNEYFVTWEIQGVLHQDTLQAYTGNGKSSVIHSMNLKDGMDFDSFKSLYSCKIVSADSTQGLDISNLEDYSVQKSSEPFFNLIGYDCHFEIL